MLLKCMSVVTTSGSVQMSPKQNPGGDQYPSKSLCVKISDSAPGKGFEKRMLVQSFVLLVSSAVVLRNLKTNPRDESSL